MGPNDKVNLNGRVILGEVPVLSCIVSWLLITMQFRCAADFHGMTRRGFIQETNIVDVADNGNQDRAQDLCLIALSPRVDKYPLDQVIRHIIQEP